MEAKDIASIILTAWANILATATLIHNIRKDKKDTAPPKPTKQKRKR